MKLAKYDYIFFLILMGGSILRIISTIIVPLNPDADIYIVSARGMLKYASYRPPMFPLFISLFLLITGNEGLAVNLTSLTAGILLIFYSYLVFSKASMKLVERKNMGTDHAKLIGLITSTLVALNLFLVYNNGRGLREELITLLCILIFYFTIVKEEHNFKNMISLSCVVVILTLTHLTFGLFMILGILFYSLLPYLKYIHVKKPSLRKLVVILLSFSSTFFIWALYNAYKVGDPFFNFHYHSLAFDFIYGINLSSLSGILNAAVSGLLFGIPYEFYYMFILLGFVIVLMGVYFLIKNIKKIQIFFIFIVTGINFLYLSIFMAIPGDPRLIQPFFPYILYLVGIGLANIINHYKTIHSEKSDLGVYNFLVICFFITYFLRGIENINLSLNPIIALLSLIFLIINEIVAFIVIYKSKNANIFFLN
ncbi:MAG: membrane protein of unknown function [Promethearchaeota archaeon]|nr:MAG: membrane protein of unknown function [Candidatus Lokiarchaeota archaeon]